MGELFNKRMDRIKRLDAPWRANPATEAQKAWLRRLCEEQDGTVDEVWLEALTGGQASAEIDRRKGEQSG